MVCNIYFIRHFEPKLPAKGKVLCGGSVPGSELDTGLTEESRDKAQTLYEKFSDQHVAAIFSSPYLRTLETVRPLAQKLNLPIVVQNALNELDHGSLTGFLSEDWKVHPSWKGYSKLSRLEKIISQQADGAETDCEVIDRMRRFILSISSEYVGKTVVCASHDGAMRSVLNLQQIETLFGPLKDQSSAQVVSRIKGVEMKDAKHFDKGEMLYIQVNPQTLEIKIC